MKAQFSPWLTEQSTDLHELQKQLSAKYAYVSILATDSCGLSASVSQHTTSIGHETLSTERGFVARVYQNGHYSEYAWNKKAAPAETEKEITSELAKQEALLQELNCQIYKTAVLPDEEKQIFVEKEAVILPEKADTGKLITKMKETSDDGMKQAPHAIESVVRAQATHINKMFISTNRDLRQSYVIAENSIAIIASDGNNNTFGYKGKSLLGGLEVTDSLPDLITEAADMAEDCLRADRITPGEYTIITDPDLSGVLAHEAFGHGVEMDMFVKHRALGAEYINKRVGSDLVTMHEGALCADDVTSYAFDDEGVEAQDTVEIQNGILKTGICDSLSALRLGVQPTGNGKRQNFEHKVYTRMTNTLFDCGLSSKEEMIQSVDYGYLLEGCQSGMEDPKHWGIQIIACLGREIKDGKLTGKVVSPVLITGYVPDILGNVSMLSEEGGVFGTGACGKGYKEWVKVADGGPYIKTIGRLG